MSVSVHKLCQDKEVSMLSLADRSGLGVERIVAIFQGRWTPSPKEREKVAAALGAAREDIAWEHGTPVEHLYGPG